MVHTPKPWEWVKDDWNGGYSGIVGPDNQEVLYPSHCNDGDDGAAWFDEFPSEADRNLIKAAPNLLEECEKAVVLLDELLPWDHPLLLSMKYEITEAKGEKHC